MGFFEDSDAIMLETKMKKDAAPAPKREVNLWGNEGLKFCIWLQRNFDALIEEAKLEKEKKMGWLEEIG